MIVQRPKILVVDDIPANRVAMRKLLSSLDAEIILAGSGNDALSLMLDHDFAIALLDVQMPGMDGYELAELIRSLDKTKDIPIIFVTASYKGDRHRMMKGYDVGAVDYIEKPVDDIVLRSKVTVFLDLDCNRRRLEAEIIRHRQTEAALRAREHQFRTLAAMAPVGIFQTDTSGRCTFANAHWCRLTGLSPEQALGSGWQTAIHADDLPAVQHAWEESMNSGQPFTLEYRYSIAEGVANWVLGSAAPLADEQGTITGHIGTAMDISERKASEEKLHALVHELNLSNKELEQFAYVASHDLREPLRMVHTYVQLLERRYAAKLDDDARRFIRFAKDGAKRIDRLILDLLEYSRVGRMSKPPAPVNLAILLKDVLDTLVIAIEESGARIHITPGLPTVLGDDSELQRLLLNLLGNALKYRAPDRRPDIVIDWKRTAEELEVLVTDNGIGIAAEHYERVFMLFHRLHSQDEYEGTGIGLALCKKIVEHHGGRIWVTSVPGQGSTFGFTLPVRCLV